MPDDKCYGCAWQGFAKVCGRCPHRAAVLPVLPKKTNKYNAKRTVYNGREYASGKEAKRASELWPMLWAGTITALREQVNFPVEINGKHIMNYRADFLYLLPQNLEAGTQIEDAKGYRTPMYKLKKKMVENYYGCTIIES